MKKHDLIFIFISLVLGALCYFSTLIYIYGIAIFLLSIIDYFILIRKRFTNYTALIDRVHIGYYFINSFIITLSVKDSLEDAYQNAIRFSNSQFKAEVDQLNELTPTERVKYLADFFNLSIYTMFLNVLNLYQDQGGNILSMADNLLRECTRSEKTLNETLSIGYKHLVEFLILWAMSFAILLFMRFSIKDFYLTMLKNQIFAPLIVCFFLICIFSINLFVNQFTNLTIKEAVKQ